MEQIIGIGIIGTILSVLVRTHRPELGICTAIATGIVILSICLPQLKSVISSINDLCSQANLNTEYFKAVLKIISIAYITQFASSVAVDAGEGAIAKKIELAGKISVLVITLPIISALMTIILDTISSL